MQRFGKHINPASVLALVALVFAVTGGAYAASSSGGGAGGGRATALVAKAKSKKKSSSVGKAGPRGPQGPAGPVGSVGPQGPAGAVGAKGETGAVGSVGKEGPQGSAGSSGADGTGATTKSFTGLKKNGSEECKEGGLEVIAASGTSLVCNGAKGANGNPAEFPKELPAGRTETGTWSINMGVMEKEFALLPQSVLQAGFAIPVQAGKLAEHIYYVASGATTETGTGELTSGSQAIKQVSGTFFLGEEISGTGIPAGTVITEIPNDFEVGIIKISQPATASGASVSLTAQPPVDCKGSAENPTAVEGSICIYVVEGKHGGEQLLISSQSLFPETGAAVGFRVNLYQYEETSKPGWAWGTWAVTPE